MDSEEDTNYDYDEDNMVFEMDTDEGSQAVKSPLKSSQQDRTPGSSSSQEDKDYGGDETDDNCYDDEIDLQDINEEYALNQTARFHRNSLYSTSKDGQTVSTSAEHVGSPLTRTINGGDGRETLATVDTNGHTVPYDVLTPEQIWGFMTEVVNSVNQVLQLPSTTVRLLLGQLHWDKERLIEKYYDNSEKLFRDAHVASPVEKSQPAAKRNQKYSKTECEICFSILRGTGNELKATDCGHAFCSPCWKTYILGKILDENLASTIECPAHKCHILVDDVFVMELIKDNVGARRRYQKSITNTFVECHKQMCWCPGTDCMYAIRVTAPEWMPVTCTQCHTTFCFLCSQPWHDPVTCALLKRWQRKCADDSETSNWIAANTKECPQCHATIEKDGGCNHMVCKNVACKNEFCWICLGPWSAHGSSWFKCNRYSDDESKAARDAQDKSRQALQRYLFYFNRFMNHQQSLKLEYKLKGTIRQKMEEMQQHNMSWIEVQFLQKAVNALQQCRQTLMYTYVFAFYLLKDNQQIIFEGNQADLENATETLSGYLERDLAGQDVMEVKQKVQDKARYCEVRRRALVEHVHEGYEKDWWNFSY